MLHNSDSVTKRLQIIPGTTFPKLIHSLGILLVTATACTHLDDEPIDPVRIEARHKALIPPKKPIKKDPLPAAILPAPAAGMTMADQTDLFPLMERILSRVPLSTDEELRLDQLSGCDKAGLKQTMIVLRVLDKLNRSIDSKTEPVMTLEDAMMRRNCNLGKILSNQTMLQHPEVLRMVVRASGKDTDIYKSELLAVVDGIKASWRKKEDTSLLAATTQVEAAATATTTEAQSDQAAPTANEATQGQETSTDPYGLIETNDPKQATWQKARELAEKLEYQQAIQLIKSIKAESPADQNSQATQIKEWSNAAVTELRRQAARSFQSSLPISDKAARTTYLLEAKKYLEKAINDFPEADRLDTVKRNLAVIERDIARLN